MCCFSRKEVSLREKGKYFCSKWNSKLIRRPFKFWQKVVFTEKTRVCISSDGIVRVFHRNGTRVLEKSTKSLS